MVVVFGCARSLKGVVGRGWIRCGLWVVGCGSALLWVSGGCGSAWLWVVGCGSTWLWVVDRRGWVVVVDRRVGMKRVVGRGSAAKVGRGRGWVVAEVAPVMTFFEWVCSSGFQIVVGL